MEYQSNYRPEPYAVFVQNIYADYVQEQLELGYPQDQVLTLEEYTHTHHGWLLERYKEHSYG